MSATLDRWNPITPLAVAVAMVVAAFAGPQPWTAALVLAIALAAAYAFGAGARVLRLTALVALPTFALLVLLAAAFPDAPAAHGRWVPTEAAVMDALAIALRLGAAIASLGVVIAGVPPRRLTRALAARGLPAWAAYLVIASLEAVPDARRGADEVLDAQRCRGVAVGRGTGLRGRLRALPALAGPLVVGLVVESEERALALDARGFDPRARRTALIPIADARGERWLRAAIWIALVVLLGWRLVALARSFTIAP